MDILGAIFTEMVEELINKNPVHSLMHGISVLMQEFYIHIVDGGFPSNIIWTLRS